MARTKAFSDFAAEVLKRKTEAAQVRTAARLLAALGHDHKPVVNEGKYGNGSTLRFYLWLDSPVGDVALVTGPSTIGEIYTLDELEKQEAPEGFYIEAGTSSRNIEKLVKQVATKAPKTKATPKAKAKAKTKRTRKPAAAKRARKPAAPSYTGFEAVGGGSAPYRAGHGPHAGFSASDIDVVGGGSAPYRPGVQSYQGTQPTPAAAAGVDPQTAAILAELTKIAREVLAEQGA